MKDNQRIVAVAEFRALNGDSFRQSYSAEQIRELIEKHIGELEPRLADELEILNLTVADWPEEEDHERMNLGLSLTGNRP